jgi:hypothetical protein
MVAFRALAVFVELPLYFLVHTISRLTPQGDGPAADALASPVGQGRYAWPSGSRDA